MDKGIQSPDQTDRIPTNIKKAVSKINSLASSMARIEQYKGGTLILWLIVPYLQKGEEIQVRRKLLALDNVHDVQFIYE